MKKLKEQNQTVNLPQKNSKLLLIKILIIEIIKMILTTKVIYTNNTIIATAIITIIIKC